MPTTIATQVKRLEMLLGMLRPAPDEWVRYQSRNSVSTSGDELECKPCHSYRVLREQWRKALKWTDRLDCTLSVMLATTLSTPFVGEQLWFKIIGPPSSGKTTLLEGISVNKRHVLSKDTIRGFYSGYKAGKDEEEEDDSIAARAKNKTLATKDGDTLLKAPNLGQILAEARGLYDRVGRTHYRNRISHTYEGHRMTWLLCGTKALREIDDSELGARFLDCVVMDEIDDEFEDAVGFRAAIQEARNMLQEADGSMESTYPPELAEAMQLTGGYVDYLRENGARLTAKVHVREDHLKQIHSYGKFVAYMRARPPKKADRRDEEDVEREFSPRLTKQLTRLAIALAVVLNRPEIDSEIMRRVQKIALDTARGQTMHILREMMAFPKGVTPGSLAVRLPPSEEKLAKLLKFLKQIGVCETVQYTTNGVKNGPVHWRATTMLRRLYEEVTREG